MTSCLWLFNLGFLCFFKYMLDDEISFNKEMRDKYGENEYNNTPRWVPVASRVVGVLIGLLIVLDALFLWAYFTLQR